MWCWDGVGFDFDNLIVSRGLQIEFEPQTLGMSVMTEAEVIYILKSDVVILSPSGDEFCGVSSVSVLEINCRARLNTVFSYY